MYASIGAVAINENPVATNQAIIALEPNPCVVDVEYLAFCLRYLAADLASRNIQTTQRNVNAGIVRAFEIPVPPISEQQRIASALSTIQANATALQYQLHAAGSVKAAMLNQAFDEEPRVPGGPYRQLRLSAVGEVQTGVAKNTRLQRSEPIAVPYLRVANVQDGRLDLSEMKTIDLSNEEIRRHLLRRGDVVITEGGDIDKVGRGFIWRGEVERCVHQNHIFAVRCDTKELLPEYLAYFIQSKVAKAYFLNVAHRTTHLACINSAKLSQLPIPLPPLEQQTSVARRLTVVDEYCHSLDAGLSAMDGLFQSVATRLLGREDRIG